MSLLLANTPSIAQRNATIQQMNLLMHGDGASSCSAYCTAILDKCGATAQDKYVQLRKSFRQGAPVAPPARKQNPVKLVSSLLGSLGVEQLNKRSISSFLLLRLPHELPGKALVHKESAL